MIETKVVDEELTISPPHKKHEEPRSNIRGSLRYSSQSIFCEVWLASVCIEKRVAVKEVNSNNDSANGACEL